jgi:hypothetical protein
MKLRVLRHKIERQIRLIESGQLRLGDQLDRALARLECNRLLFTLRCERETRV